VQFNGLFDISRLILEISLKLFGMVLRKLYERYKDDN
jgi:hypothetical protein